MASPPHRRPLFATIAAATLLLSGACSSGSSPQQSSDGAIPAELAFDPNAPVSAEPTTTAPGQPAARPTTTLPAPIPAGNPAQPFAPLPDADQATAIITPSGVVVPVITDHRAELDRDSWLVATPCADIRTITEGEPVGRAHVVLDPGHGGHEYGAVGPSGLTEKELNLGVALAAQRLLTEAGATVVLTRSTDVTMTTGVRAMLARQIQPALFVSIHHNGGSPAGGNRPGTIVFTKSENTSATRFGGLFYEELTPKLEMIGDARREEFEAYAEAFLFNEDLVATYDQSVAARDAALVANGQLDSTVTTLPPERPREPRSVLDGSEVPSVRQPLTTTTMPIPDDRVPVPVPDTLAVPPSIELERVAAFSWAGTGNAGVRSWRGDDGRDLLSVLRRSGAVPAALVEYLYVTNPVEEALLAESEFIELEAQALADSIIRFLSTQDAGSGFVDDQIGDQDIGGGGHRNDCIEPDLGLTD
ncbi:MAG: N-acetylmuramoyl-L-alanine amidase family protein [Acidimicrobiales bacterium]